MVVSVDGTSDDVTVLAADGELEGVGVHDVGVTGLFETLRHRPWLTEGVACRRGDTPYTSVQKYTHKYRQIHGELTRKFSRLFF